VTAATGGPAVTGVVIRLGRLAAWLGLAALEYAVAVAYSTRGTWWHFLLHQMVGWGTGLAVAALVASVTRYRVPAVVALVGGQLFSITPDLMFRYMRMPHEPSMDVFLGHISIHRGPSPMLVALGCLLLGGWAFVAAGFDRRRTAGTLAAGAVALVTVACLLAAPIPDRLSDFPRDTSVVRS
jgi:hypothetical protein